MKKRKFLLAALGILAILIIPVFINAGDYPIGVRKLIVFYSTTCHKCFAVKNKLMPDIEKRFKDRIEVEYRDIADVQNYKLLLSMQEKYAVKIKNILPVFYFEGQFINGRGPIKRKLISLIENSIIKPTLEEKHAYFIDLVSHFLNFRPWAVASAGLIDGINPCAFTVIVFFISFLALQGYRKRELIVIGLAFILAVFLTYLLIGLGLFNALYQLKGFWLVSRTVNFAIGVLSMILGILALYDFFKFKKTGKTEGLILQLPKGIKNQIHKVVGWHYRVNKTQEGVSRRHIFTLIFSALITGFSVSILEAVCTGQTYLPTITFILKTTHLKLQALGYLLLYNFMFVVPLLIIFLFALLGATSEQFSQVLKKHFLTIKILMAVLFFGLGIFLLWRP